MVASRARCRRSREAAPAAESRDREDRRAGPGKRRLPRAAAGSLEARRPDRPARSRRRARIVWAITGFLSFQSGVSAANKRFDHEHGARAALAKSNGFLLDHGTTILLLGTDSSTAAGRSGDRHADSIMLVRTDPSHHRLSYLSIPRDLLVQRPGRREHEDQRVLPGRRRGARDQDGARASRASRSTTWSIVDFNNFKDLIDAEGGITINVPEAIRSNRFDCPYTTRGPLPAVEGLAVPPRAAAHERRAGADLLADPREPAEPGRERPHPRRAPAGGRAGGDGEADLGLDAPRPARSTASSLMKPLTTDLSTWQLIELGWVKFRASGSHTLYCRLGGDADDGRRLLGDRPVRGQPRTCSRCGPASRRRSRRRRPTGPGCRTGHPLQ